MRAAGIVLLVLGALILGRQGFTHVTDDGIAGVDPTRRAVEREKSMWMPPAVGGIAILGGLALLVVGRKGD